MAFTNQSGVFIYKLLLTFQLMDQIAENDLMMIQKDGSVALTTNWDAGSYNIKSLTFESDVATGTAPFVVASTTRVSNLNVTNSHEVDGYHAGNASGQVALSNTTVCTDLNADTVDGVHAVTFATFNYSGAKVYDAAAPVAMTDLDLSGTVGANRTLIYLKVKLDDAAGGATYHFKTNGETDILDPGIGGVSGSITLATNTRFKYVWVLTDTSGIVEWYATVARNTEIYVLAYMKGG